MKIVANLLNFLSQQYSILLPCRFRITDINYHKYEFVKKLRADRTRHSQFILYLRLCSYIKNKIFWGVLKVCIFNVLVLYILECSDHRFQVYPNIYFESLVSHWFHKSIKYNIPKFGKRKDVEEGWNEKNSIFG